MEQTTQEVTTVSTQAPQEVIKKTTVVTPPVQTEHPQKVFEKKKTLFHTYQIIWYILGIIEVLLGFRMALKALGANAASFFTSLIYTLSEPLVIPFSGILPSSGTITATFEWTTIIAAIVYLILAYGIVQLLALLKPVTPHEVEHTVDTT